MILMRLGARAPKVSESLAVQAARVLVTKSSVSGRSCIRGSGGELATVGGRKGAGERASGGLSEQLEAVAVLGLQL